MSVLTFPSPSDTESAAEVWPGDDVFAGRRSTRPQPSHAGFRTRVVEGPPPRFPRISSRHSLNSSATLPATTSPPLGGPTNRSASYHAAPTLSAAAAAAAATTTAGTSTGTNTTTGTSACSSGNNGSIPTPPPRLSSLFPGSRTGRRCGRPLSREPRLSTLRSQQQQQALLHPSLLTDEPRLVLQGYCRMAWFARLRCTRFLRLVAGSLYCFDAALRHRLWVVLLEGARVRIHLPNNKIVLSKLQCGFIVEFYVFDQQSCKHWASELLRASIRNQFQAYDDS